MEPNARSITEDLATDIQRAINALPPAHQVEPQDLTIHAMVTSDYKIGFLHKDLH